MLGFRRWLAIAWAACVALLAAASQASAAGVVSTYVVFGENGEIIARALTEDAACPAITIDGQTWPMTLLRAPAETIALRPTRSDPADSKPSAFPILTCEAGFQAGVGAASIEVGSCPCRRRRSAASWSSATPGAG